MTKTLLKQSNTILVKSLFIFSHRFLVLMMSVYNENFVNLDKINAGRYHNYSVKHNLYTKQ